MTLAALDEMVSAYLRKRRFKGGGGTDHRPIFRLPELARFRPDLFIGLTDLLTHFPRKAPPFPVIWLVPEDHGTAPWGFVVEA